MMAGVTVVTWYPITPSSSLCESLIDYMAKYRLDKETGKATFAIVGSASDTGFTTPNGVLVDNRWLAAAG